MVALPSRRKGSGTPRTFCLRASSEPTMQRREARGQWWSPDRPDDKVAGTLTFTPSETLVLRTIGKLRSRVSPTPEGAILLGNTTEGAVTLFRCGDDSSPLSEALAQIADAVEWDYYAKFAL